MGGGVCDECEETFSAKCTLKEHMSAEHKKTCRVCDECGETFREKGTIKEHKC